VAAALLVAIGVEWVASFVWLGRFVGAAVVRQRRRQAVHA
jgi:hypothetical protein